MQMDFSQRAKAESVAIFFKSISTYAFLYLDFGLMAYSLAQIAYSLCLLFIFARVSDLRMEQFKVVPIRSKKGILSNYLTVEDEEDLNHFTRICLLKFFLSEGEKIMISYMSFAGSGINDEAAELALISNLISIVCRFIFHPLEEVGLNLFAKLEEVQSIDVLAKYLAGVLGIGVSAAVFAQMNAMEFL